MENNVVIYQSNDGLVKMEAIVDASNETIWATQKAMAHLLGVDRSVITRHLSNIFKEEELDKKVVCAKFAQTTLHGAIVGEFQTRDVQFYNLDAIISVGYRVNSRKATAFRQWATSVLKQYMVKGYAVNQNAVSEQKYEDLKRALGLLENVFSQNLIMAEQQAKELFAVVKDYTYALVSRGYYLAFQTVKESVKEVLEGADAGMVVKKNHQQWYLQMWSPFVGVGLLKASDLIGYRNNQVYIKGSLHTPLSPDNVRVAMPVLFDLLKNEPNAVVRAVLGHFFFGYVHPYMDGNGRMCRFLMNVMLASGGYDWVVITTDKRAEYMVALESASVKGDILPFAKFVTSMI